MKVNKEISYITNSKAKEIIRGLKPEKEYTNQQLDNLYKSKVGHILSKKEMAALQILKEFYSEENFKLESYKKIQRQHKNNRQYILNKSSSPSYHHNSQCTALASKFENYKLPDEIKHRGEKEVDDFINFFIENLNTLREKPDVFNFRLYTRFKIHEPIEQVSFENSGVHEIANLDLVELEKKIDQLLFDAEKFKSRNPETKNLIIQKGYGTDRELRKPQKQEDYEILTEWHKKYKGDLKHLLGEYFRVKLNPDLKFESTLLNQLGFTPCKICTPVETMEFFVE
jgi:hypothetical protein